MPSRTGTKRQRLTMYKVKAGISYTLWIGLWGCLIFLSSNLQAQVAELDSNGLKLIRISHTDSVIGTQGEVKNYQRLLGAVVIEHDGVTMTCDSAHLFLELNYVEAFSQVNISKANGVNLHSDYLRYSGNNNTALLKGDVQIIDGANSLFTEELTYNIKTKIGRYDHGGTLQTDETTVNSVHGTYNGYSQQSYFSDSVVVTNPKYNVESKEITYNIKTKVVKFLAASTIITENSTITTRAGTYDSKNATAVFTSRTTVESDDQTIIGNTMTYNDKTGYGKAKGDVVIIDLKNETKINADFAEYNKSTGYGKASGHVVIEQEDGKITLTAKETEFNKISGYGKAFGHVVVIDTAQHSKLIAEVVEYNDYSKFMMATQHPKLITLADKDSLFMRADTLMSVRKMDAQNLKWVRKKPASKKEKIDTYIYNLLIADSSYQKPAEGTPDPKLIVANHIVKIFSDSMQAVCDSLIYDQTDSTFRLFKNPVMWSKTQQSTADTIFLKTIQNKLSEVNLIGTAMLISETGYEKMYDQVSGNFIDAYFNENQIYLVHVNQNAESIYYAKDDDGGFLGMNKAECAQMNVYFEDKTVRRIVFLDEPKGHFPPIDKMLESDRYLTGFKWLIERKPKSKEEIMNN
ncbi:MAG: hypothetical protein JNJ58_10955 [Chitinophagaceae bacterium]|nr:hypothetical protein [Chitinophagaceae bacterium]